MDLIEKFIDGRTDFSSYDDFHQHCKLKLPEHFNFATDVVDYYAEKTPEKIALVWCNDDGLEKIFTFSQLANESIKAAGFLSNKGITAGDVVMLSLHRRYEYWIFILALHRLGAIALPVPSQLLKDDLEYRIKTSKTKMIVAVPHDDSINQIEQAAGPETILVAVNFCKDKWINFSLNDSDLCGGAAEAMGMSGGAAAYGAESFPEPQISPASPMIIYFTSGTAGEPKMVVHDYLYPLSHVITAKYWQCVVPDGLHFSVAETGWAKASWGKIYGQWIAGSAVFVYDRQTFSPERILEKVSKYKVTTFCANPTVYRYLLNHDFSDYDLSSVKHCCSAGEALPSDVAKTFKEKTGLTIYEGYGQSETSLITANFCFDEMPAAMGKASPMYDIQLIDDAGKNCPVDEPGEIVLSLKNGHPAGLFTGYYKDEKLTAQVFKDGLYHTGDIAVKDKDGNFHFKGRKDDIIKSSGFRISPYEVENVLNRHPAVFECAVAGEKDETRGQIVVAFVVPALGYTPSKNLEHELISFMHKNTALYKCPRKIEFVKELSKTYNGKISRRKGMSENDGLNKDDKSE